MARLCALFGGLILLCEVSYASIVSQPQALSGFQYDFVVVGGGTAGNVIANRLTENPSVSVLVIEAGGSPDGNLDISVPFFCPRIAPETSVDWNYTTIPQAGLNGRSMSYPRGHVLGGSSSINFMLYTRGSREDYNRYAQISGDPGWGWDELQPYFRKNEIFTPPADHHNTTGEFDPAAHGFNGINSVSLYGYPQSIDGRVVEATKQLEEFPYNQDYNSGYQIGIGWAPFTIKDGARSSSATSYLGPQFIGRKNLHVLLHTQVSRVLSSGHSHGVPILNTIEYQSSNGTFQTITARREVILSAGAINTPKILLHSGIGDSAVLSKFGIKTLVNNPSVGQNLSDHPVIGNQWTVDSTDTFEKFTRNATATQADLELWTNSRSGVLASGTANNIGWVRLPANFSLFKTEPDPAAGPHTAHIELIISNGDSRPPFPATGNFLTVSAAFLTPTSRGSVAINSSNPFDPPLIDTGFLTTPFDIAGMREAIRTARRFVAAPAWANYTIASLTNATTNAEIDAYARSGSFSLYHAMGTAAMTPRDADHGVVDPDLVVKGTVGLRIVDASVVPVVPAAHTQVVTYVFAERGADLIKAKWGL